MIHWIMEGVFVPSLINLNKGNKKHFKKSQLWQSCHWSKGGNSKLANPSWKNRLFRKSTLGWEIPNVGDFQSRVVYDNTEEETYFDGRKSRHKQLTYLRTLSSHGI